MEAFCVGPDHTNRIFDGYLYKTPDSFDLSLNIPVEQDCRMSEQTYQTPNLGDEEFDLPPLLSDGAGQQSSTMYPTMEMSAPMTSTVDTMTSVGYQQHHQQPPQPHPMFYRLDRDPYGAGAPSLPPPPPPPPPQPPRPYPPAGQQHPGLYAAHELMAHHHVRPPMFQGHGLMGPPATGSPGRINNSPGHTTSEDSSDDSTSRAQWMRGERPSPEPAQIDLTSMKPAKKPRVTRKRKKRDPNEPEKPVSAYALFFRDTQATIKGHNPNASFGEVSKIVASMWEALETDNKNMYKKKTENAKKEYLKALAAYRASLISKNNSEEPRSPALYGGYGGYGGGTGGYANGNFPTPYSRPAPAAAAPQSPLVKKSPLLSSLMGDGRPPPDPAGTLMPPPAMYPPPQGMLGQPRLGPPLPGAGYPPAGLMMPPVSQALYMHHQQQQRQMAEHQLGNPQPPPQSRPQQVPSHSPPGLGSVLSPPPPLASPPALSSPLGPSPPSHPLSAQQQQLAHQHHLMMQQHQQQELHELALKQQLSPHQQQHQSHHLQQQHQQQQQQLSPHQQQAVDAAAQQRSPATSTGSPAPATGSPAVSNPDWEEAYCGSGGLANGCRDAFNSWAVSAPVPAAAAPITAQTPPAASGN